MAMAKAANNSDSPPVGGAGVLLLGCYVRSQRILAPTVYWRIRCANFLDNSSTEDCSSTQDASGFERVMRDIEATCFHGLTVAQPIAVAAHD
jgi:hypothetical protein